MKPTWSAKVESPEEGYELIKEHLIRDLDDMSLESIGGAKWALINTAEAAKQSVEQSGLPDHEFHRILLIYISAMMDALDTWSKDWMEAEKEIDDE